MKTVGMRIISLAPTQTEIIAALGMTENLAGRTLNCDYPPEVRAIPTFGSWYVPDLEGVVHAGPDLVCTFGERQLEMKAHLEKAGVTVCHCDPKTVREALATIMEIAQLMGCEGKAADLLNSLNARLDAVAQKVARRSSGKRPRVLRILDWNPIYTVGSGAFQYDVVELAGGAIPVSGPPDMPYFICTPEEILAADPEVLFFCEEYIREILLEDETWKNVSAVRNSRIFIFDCGLTCRSGPRIVDMVEQLAEAIHSG